MIHDLYLHPKKDSDEELRLKGTKTLATVISIEMRRNTYIVELYDEECEKFYTIKTQNKPKCYIGSKVPLYVDDIDADGEFTCDI